LLTLCGAPEERSQEEMASPEPVFGAFSKNPENYAGNNNPAIDKTVIMVLDSALAAPIKKGGG
jgi:hypothetical protein